jgi:hypothetical protein
MASHALAAATNHGVAREQRVAAVTNLGNAPIYMDDVKIEELGSVRQSQEHRVLKPRN